MLQILLRLVIICLTLSTSSGYTETPQKLSQTEKNDSPKEIDFSKFATEDYGGEEGNRFYQEFLKMMMVLGFLILMIFIAMWVLKRIFNQRIDFINKSSRIKIVESRTLSPKACLYLLEVNDSTIILAESPSGIHTVAQFSGNKSSPTFKSVYERQSQNDDKTNKEE